MVGSICKAQSSSVISVHAWSPLIQVPETIKQKVLQLTCKQARYGWLHKDISIWFLAIAMELIIKTYTDKL